MQPKHNRLLTIANIIWILVIFILCAIPGKDIPDPHLNIPHLDKLVHFGMFFILALLLAYRLDLHTSLSRKQIYLISVLTAFLYGGAIEILQHYFFNRSGDVWDLLADVLGGFAGCLSYPLSRRLFLRDNQKNKL